MAKSFKFKDNNFLDSKGVVHNKEILSEILDRCQVYSNTINGESTYNFNTIFNQIPLANGINIVAVAGQTGSNGLSVKNRAGFPTGAYPWGSLICIKRGSGSGYSDSQIYIPDNIGLDPYIYCRTMNYKNWRRIEAGNQVAPVTGT